MLQRRLRYVLFALLFPAASLDAQGTVVGTVTDSVGHHPVVGALVQLAGSGSFVKTVNSDSLGGYRITGLPPGTYLIGFFHPTLDSLGIDLSPKQVTVPAAGGEQRFDLAIPPAQRIAAQLCHATKDRDSTGLLIGHLRDAETRQPRKGSVTVLWMELTIGQGGVHRTRQQIPIKTDDLGWFAMCGLPSDEILQASAQAGAEESGVVELQLPAGGLLLRDFLVSQADSLVPVFDDSSAGKACCRCRCCAAARPA